MKIFVISDIHGSLSALRAALAAREREGAQWVAVLGDYLNHGPRNPIPEGYDPQAVAKELNALRDWLIPVRGNCDSEVDQMLLDFPMLGEYATVFLGGRRLFLCHGHVASPESLPPLPPDSLFISGHSHLPLLERRGSLILMNPGSITLPKGGNPRSYGLIEEGGLWIKTIEGEALLSLAF